MVFLDARWVVTVLWDATRAALLFSRPPTGLAVGFGLRSVPYGAAEGGPRRTDSPLAPVDAGRWDVWVPGSGSAVSAVALWEPPTSGSRVAGLGVNPRHRP